MHAAGCWNDPSKAAGLSCSCLVSAVRSLQAAAGQRILVGRLRQKIHCRYICSASKINRGFSLNLCFNSENYPSTLMFRVLLNGAVCCLFPWPSGYGVVYCSASTSHHVGQSALSTWIINRKGQLPVIYHVKNIHFVNFLKHRRV